MALTQGDRFGAYEIVAPLGAGGMGEVYRARDTRLNRDVAIKIIPHQLADNAQALTRFEREAQAVAALSHPNILAVHDIGQADGVSFVVFELLDGATLRDRLETGPLPVRAAIDYARQIADGLAAAHEKGVTHRDIKPANVLVTDDGRVKILDFGLAQIAPPAEGADSMTQAPITDPGIVLGTIGYMAPEQVRGGTIDHRADFFALGCVLYEMCTGTRAFAGPTPADTMSAILFSEPPDLALLGQPAASALGRIVRRCLEKSPAARFQSARDLSFALDALLSQSGSGGAVVVEPRVPDRAWSIAATAFVAVIGGALLGRAFWLPPDLPAAPGPPRLRAEFSGDSEPTRLALSPDGGRLLMTQELPTGGRGLVIRDLGSGLVTPIPGGENGMAGAWSRAGDAVIFFSPGELRRYRIGEQSATTVTPLSGEPRGAAWLSDGTIVYALGSGVSRVSENGGPPVVVAFQEGGLLGFPAAIGNRSDYVLALQAYSGSGLNRRIIAIRLADGTMTDLVASDAAPHLASGQLLLTGANGLAAQPFDLNRLEVTGEPVSLAEPVMWDPGTGNVLLSTSDSGVIAFRPGRTLNVQFEWLDQTGNSVGRVGAAGFFSAFSLSPDGKRLIVRQVGGVGRSGGTSSSLMYMDLERGIETPIRTPDGPVSDPIWTADGSQIVYRLGPALMKQSPFAATPDVLRKQQIYPDAVSGDGKWLLGGVSSPRGFELYVMPFDGQGDPVLIPTAAVTDEAMFSPDSRLVSYHSNQSGRPEVYLARFPLTDERWQLSSAGGVQARWAGRELLYYLAPDGVLMRIRIPGGDPSKSGRPEAMFKIGIASPSPQFEQYVPFGDRFLVQRPSEQAARSTIAVVSNWKSVLKAPSSQ